MKRSAVRIADVADWHNLARAFRLAARGKRGRADVEAFRQDLERELSRLQAQILDGSIAVGMMRSFRIRDPKPRMIHAPCFRERVLHHAIMAHVGPVLDRSLIFDTYACREGKGALAAVRRASQHARRHAWYAQIDVRSYFASINHSVLLSLLERKLKDHGLLSLLARIIESHHDTPGRGLPIGALTSQYFANFYLGGLDRTLLEECRMPGYVRYMDDMVWWGTERAVVRRSLGIARAYLAEPLRLEIKIPAIIGRSNMGLVFCGYRIMSDRLLLSRRRKRRYMAIRRYWEWACAVGRIDTLALQAGYASAMAIAKHADSTAWRRAELLLRPVEPILLEL
jgi:RNA-directed DNA polymerase